MQVFQRERSPTWALFERWTSTASEMLRRMPVQGEQRGKGSMRDPARNPRRDVPVCTRYDGGSGWQWVDVQNKVKIMYVSIHPPRQHTTLYAESLSFN